MIIPSHPEHVFSQPFAIAGAYTILPDARSETGRASLSEGFPAETQLPLSHGGTAPNRMDLNGILHMITSFAFWQQSGGQWTWKAALTYDAPALVCHKNQLWWCKGASGPETERGPVEPGTDTACWEELLIHLFDSGSLKMKSAMPVGTVISYHGARVPEGYLECDGRAFSATAYPGLFALLGKSTTPDLRGQFIRGYDPDGASDPQGRQRAVGSRQLDMGRAATGNISHGAVEEGASASGVFRLGSLGQGGRGRAVDYGINFDISRAWGAAHTGTEFRPVNTCVLYCIKHDE